MLNTIILSGRLTKDPELRYTQSQKPVASFTLACDRDYQPGGTERQCDFINCVAWNQSAEFVSKHFFKGQMMTVKGRLTSRKWQDKNGNNRTEWEVVTENVYFGSEKPKGDAPNGFADLEDDDGEIPF